jgi:hypothetical protein
MFISVIFNIVTFRFQFNKNLVVTNLERVLLSKNREYRDNYNLNWWFQSRLDERKHQ